MFCGECPTRRYTALCAKTILLSLRLDTINAALCVLYEAATPPAHFHTTNVLF